MKTGLFAQFRPIIAAASEADIDADPTLGGRLLLAGEGDLTVSYAPFDHVVSTARVVIVGITPGAYQAGEALAEAHRRILAGDSDEDALAAAKVHGSFSGDMREGLVAMLDQVGLNRKLGIGSCDSLWDSHSHLAHFTSALRYPVFVAGENFNGDPAGGRPALLRQIVETHLAEEARALPEALWIACGSKPASALRWLAARGILDPANICEGLPHPSRANAERVHYFLGLKDRGSLSRMTNPDLIDAAKARMTAQIETFGPDRSAAVGSSVRHTAPVAPARSKASPARAERTRSEKPEKSEGRSPSPLGIAIQAAVEANGRYVLHQPSRLYHHTMRTREKGTVFAVERCTKNAIVLWLPAPPTSPTRSRKRVFSCRR